MTQNQILFANYVESQLHNRNTEAETARSNRARETETNRSNLAHEAETNRSNLATETETNRSNLANEAERQRSNKAQEQLTRERDKEQGRHNVATENLTSKQQEEQERANQEAEKIEREKIAKDLTIANLTAQTNKTIAEIQARVDQYVAQLRANTDKWNKIQDAKISRDRNNSTKYVEEYKANMQKAVAAADRMAEAIRSGKDRDLQKQYLKLEQYKAKIDAMYKNKQITLQAWKAANQTLGLVIDSVKIGSSGGKK